MSENSKDFEVHALGTTTELAMLRRFAREMISLYDSGDFAVYRTPPEVIFKLKEVKEFYRNEDYLKN